MTQQFKQWIGIALASLFFLYGATVPVRAEVPILSISQFTTTKGCYNSTPAPSPAANYAVGEALATAIRIVASSILSRFGSESQASILPPSRIAIRLHNFCTSSM